MQVQIKREKQEDYNEVDFLLKLAFDNDHVAQVVQNLRLTDDFIPELSKVARINDQIIGVIMYSHALITKGRKTIKTISLAPLAVLPAYQNLGIGGELIKSSFRKARELGYESVVVIGHEDYYPRFGFKPASEYDIICPFDVPDENFMAKELVPDKLAKANGKFKVHSLISEIVQYSL